MSTTDEDTRPVTGRAGLPGVIGLAVPPIAWITSLAASFVLQHFICSAYSSAGRVPPQEALLVGITVVNVALLAITIACGVIGWRESRRAENVRRFLGYVTIGSAAILGWGIVLIAVNPFALEVCA
ncbi:MAG: hypothetical protein Q4G43_12095 [Mobilicoccus sp.]|nr:hypothetical protein [Mobilicoccus sp.]